MTYNLLTPLFPFLSPRPFTNTSPWTVLPQKKLGESGKGATRICGCEGTLVGGASPAAGGGGWGSDIFSVVNVSVET